MLKSKAMADPRSDVRRKISNEGKLLKGRKLDYRAFLALIAAFGAIDFWVISAISLRNPECAAGRCSNPHLYIFLPLLIGSLIWPFLKIKASIKATVWVLAFIGLCLIAVRGPWTHPQSASIPTAILAGGALLLPWSHDGTKQTDEPLPEPTGTTEPASTASTEPAAADASGDDASDGE